MEKFTQKWAIIIPLKNHADGSEFYFTDFPLHITLAGVFATSETGDQLEDMLEEIASLIRPFTITASQEEWFGEQKDIPVMKIQQSSELMNLYKVIHDDLVKRNVVFNAPQYEGEGYIAHSTHQKSGRLHEGEKVLAKSIALVDLFPNDDGLMRRITKTINFSKT